MGINELINRLNIKNLFFYTSNFIEDLNDKLSTSGYDGLMIPIGIRDNCFYVLEKGIRDDKPLFKERSISLQNFLQRLELGDKQLLLSMIDFFDDCSDRF